MTKVLNPLVVRLAGRRYFPMVAQIHHRGRMSGRPYVTPANARRSGETIVVPLTFGAQAQWSRNIQAAGGCTIRLKGVDHAVRRPEILEASAVRPLLRSAFSAPERAAFRLMGIEQVMRLELGPAEPCVQHPVQRL